MRVISSVPVLASVALSLTVAACGPASSPNKDAAASAAAPTAVAAVTTPDACDVLTEAIAKKYLGPTAVLRRKYRPNPQMTQCQWGGDDGVITVMVGPWSMVYDESPVATVVSGIGDEAHIDPTTLYVRKGDKGVSIGVIGASGEYWGKAADDMEVQMADAEKKVAPDLLPNL